MYTLFITQQICFPLFSVLSYDSYLVFWVKITTLFGVSILVTTYPEYSWQTLLCNKHNVSNLIWGIHSCQHPESLAIDNDSIPYLTIVLILVTSVWQCIDIVRRNKEMITNNMTASFTQSK